MKTKKNIFLTTLLVLFVVTLFQGRSITEKSSVSASTNKEATTEAELELPVMLPANAKVYMRYRTFADGKYKIYRAGNSYFLCHKKEILAVTDLKEDLMPVYFKKCSIWPFAYSVKNNLYIIQANFTEPKLEFVKVAENCQNIGYANNYNIHVPMYKDLSTHKKYLLLPASEEAYADYASACIIDKQTVKYSSKYKPVRLTKKNVKVELNCWGDSLRWESTYYYETDDDDRFYFYLDTPIFKADCGIKNNYLNLIIDDKKPSRLNYWAMDGLALENLDFHIERLQDYLNQWEENHDVTIFRWFLDNPDWFKILNDDSKSGLQTWLKYNQSFADELID